MTDERTLLDVVYVADRRRCVRVALALEAAGIPHRILHKPGESAIVVPRQVAAQARTELAAYESENHAAPTPEATVFETRNGWVGVFGFAVVMLVMFFLDRYGIVTERWFDAGKAQAGLIRDGEWWRAVTALTLHSGPAHLAGNIVFGSIIGLFAGRLFGSGLAWFGILLGGSVGNLLNAWIRDAGHTSIGASTGIFAAFGMVGAFATIHRQHLQMSRLGRYAPIISAVVLLSYLGTSGERTDVLAHVAGFVAGLILGTAFGESGRTVMPRARGQVLLGITTVGVVVISWLIALTQFAP